MFIRNFQSRTLDFAHILKALGSTIRQFLANLISISKQAL